MRWALATCAALLLAIVALESEGRGGGGGGRGGGAHGHAGVVHGSRFHHHHHGGTRVVVGAGFAAWPAAYYWPGYYYPPAYYGPAVAVPAPQYWYYCAPLGAYYPYVPNCPVAWDLVIPAAPQPY